MVALDHGKKTFFLTKTTRTDVLALIIATAENDNVATVLERENPTTWNHIFEVQRHWSRYLQVTKNAAALPNCKTCDSVRIDR